jgi:hypothetical protein
MKNSLTSLVRQACGHPDSFSCRNGVYTVRRGFFYRGRATAEGVAQSILKRLVEALPDHTITIVGHGEEWKPFRGGAPVAKQSHWWVKFTVSK